MGRFRKVADDAFALGRVCGWDVAGRWVANVVASFPAILRQGHLQSADVRMGDGPFRCAAGASRALLTGPQVISGIREIWCRQVYQSAEVRLPSEGLVVDLGANMGNFTILALAAGERVRAVAVEPNKASIVLLERQLAANGWARRCEVVNAVVGPATQSLKAAIAAQPATFGREMSEVQLLDVIGPGRIAFLKCDIEGSEFGLLTRRSKLLDRTDRIAMEVHHDAGDRDEIVAVLREHGFEVWVPRVNSSDSIVLGRRR